MPASESAAARERRTGSLSLLVWSPGLSSSTVLMVQVNVCEELVELWVAVTVVV